jgi:hypothetical protein
MQIKIYIRFSYQLHNHTSRITYCICSYLLLYSTCTCNSCSNGDGEVSDDTPDLLSGDSGDASDDTGTGLQDDLQCTRALPDRRCARRQRQLVQPCQKSTANVSAINRLTKRLHSASLYCSGTNIHTSLFV